MDQPEQSITELSKKVALSPSTTHRLLKTLQVYDFVEQEESTSKYRLGLALFRLGALVQHSMSLLKQAHRPLQRLAQITGDTATLFIVDNNEALCIDRIEGQYPVSILTVGAWGRLPLNCGGAPRALLAYQSDEDFERLIKGDHFRKMTPISIIEPEDLWRDIKDVREKGYSIAVDDVIEGVAAIGAPIWDNNGKVIGALSVVAITPRFGEDRQPELVKTVLEQAKNISVQLGWSET